MKNYKAIGFILGVVMLLTFATTAWGEGKYDFKKTRWGMTMEEVRASENEKHFIGEKHKNRGSIIAYKTKLLSKDVILIYSFFDNKLYDCGYQLAEKHTYNNDFINDYKAFQKALIEKYGKPTGDITRWKDERYKNDRYLWGKAVSIGHLVFHAEWETNSTKINCILCGDNSKISCAIVYTSKDLSPLVKKYEKETEKDVIVQPSTVH